jgi:hypothetical protein
MIETTGETLHRGRPSGVPEDALWFGGADGGVFLVAKPISTTPYLCHATIYNDVSGDVECRGVFAISREEGERPDLHDQQLYSFWDGTEIHLSDGRYLYRVASLDALAPL